MPSVAADDGRDAALRRPDIAARCPYQIAFCPRLRIAGDWMNKVFIPLRPLSGGGAKYNKFD
jgi:hypothetical protein